MKYMTSIFTTLALAFGLLGFAAPTAFADANYPYTHPTYIPTAVAPAVSYSAPGDFLLTNHNINVALFNVSGTCTGLAAAAQISTDGTNFVSVNVYPVGAGTVNGLSVAAASVSAAGMYRVNASGAKVVRLHITALTATCSVSASGTAGSFTTAE